MIFCGPAKKVAIRLSAHDAAWATVCEALLAFLSPKDVCCLQLSCFEDVVEIRFLAREGKVDALTNIASLIAPDAPIYAENTRIVHATTESRIDVTHERTDWESSVRFRSAVAVEKENPVTFGNAQARSIPRRPGKAAAARRGASPA